MGSDKTTAGSDPRKIHCPRCPDREIKRPERCSDTLIHGGTTLYFRSRRCKETFERNPAKYVGGPA